MARILVIGCGCRGQELTRALAADGHAVRGTTRAQSNVPSIESAGAEAVVADPVLLGTVLPHLEGVTALCWLLGSATGDAEAVEALHTARLEALLETLVDTHVRGLVYEAAGSVDPELLERGAATVRAASERFHMPAEVVQADPGDHAEWRAAMRSAVAAVLAA